MVAAEPDLEGVNQPNPLDGSRPEMMPSAPDLAAVPMLEVDGTPWSRGEFLGAVAVLGEEFRQSPPGPILALLPNGGAYLASVTAAVVSGREIVLMSPTASPRDVRRVASVTRACLVLTQRKRRLLTAAQSTGDIVPIVLGQAELRHLPGGSPRAGTWSHLTSGSTGTPKVVRRQRYRIAPWPLLGLLPVARRIFGTHSGGTHLVTAPLWHSAPLGLALSALFDGATVAFAGSGWRDVYDSLLELEVRDSFVVPPMLGRLADQAKRDGVEAFPRHLQALVHGASPCPTDVKRRAIDLFGDALWETFGTTEGGVAVISSQEWLKNPGSVGRPLPGGKFRVLVDGRFARPHEIGQVYFSATAVKYVGGDVARPQSIIDDGRVLLTTGDIGYVNEEGYLFLQGRTDTQVSIGGEKYSLEAVEQELRAHPDIVDALALTVPSRLGHRITARIVLREDAQTPSGLRTWIAGRVPRPFVPVRIEVVDAVERDPLGKVRRRSASSGR